MADISKIEGYNLKDAAARTSISILEAEVANRQTKSVVYSNITVSATPVQMSSYCAWDSEKKYGYSATVAISGLTTNSMVQNIVMTDTILSSVAPIATTKANGLTFYTEDSTALSGTIYTLVTTEAK